VERTASIFFGPAETAALSRIVPHRLVGEAVAKNDVREHTASLLGPPLRGVLFGISRSLPFVVDVISYLVSRCKWPVCGRCSRRNRPSSGGASAPRSRRDSGSSGGSPSCARTPSDRALGSLPMHESERFDSYCVMCDRVFLRRAAEVYFENDHFVYASSRDPSTPPEVLPGSGVAVPVAHRASPFDLTSDEWVALGEVLRRAKRAWDERLEPDGYGLYWTSFPRTDADVPSMHAHLHVVPRFDDEPRADFGGRVGIKGTDNRRPDPQRHGTGRARLFGG
jgi:diadenosine tetraphosphate (Ap4A) HIT family hydrolase